MRRHMCKQLKFEQLQQPSTCTCQPRCDISTRPRFLRPPRMFVFFLGTIHILRHHMDWVGGFRKWLLLLTFSMISFKLRRPHKLEKISHLVLTLLLFSKQGGRFFQILWPSHNTYLNFTVFMLIWWVGPKRSKNMLK